MNILDKLNPKLRKQQKALDELKKHTPQDLKEFISKFKGIQESELKEKNILTFLEQFKDDLNPSDSFYIFMELRNGFYKSFMLQNIQPFFHFHGGVYILDTRMKYYNATIKSWCLDFHQDLCMPVKRSINIDLIKKGIKFSKLTDIDLAINPSNVESFIEGKVIEGMIKGQKIVEELKKYYMFLIVITVASILHLVLFMVKTGMFNNVKIPGFG